LVNTLIEEAGKDDFEFTILTLCTGRCMLTYSELEAQILHDVLRARLPNGDRRFFNNAIGHLNYAGLEKQTQEACRLRSLTSTK